MCCYADMFSVVKSPCAYGGSNKKSVWQSRILKTANKYLFMAFVFYALANAVLKR